MTNKQTNSSGFKYILNELIETALHVISTKDVGLKKYGD